jgi:hypothetical protein
MLVTALDLGLWLGPRHVEACVGEDLRLGQTRGVQAGEPGP